MTGTVTPWQVRARNLATSSENRIHADDVARRFGFRGGLVPGVTTFAWLARQAVVALGREWIDRGRIQARFVQPVYEGDMVTIDAERGPAATGAEVAELVARGPGGAVAAVATAGLDPPGPAAPDLRAWPPAALPSPDDRPPATPATFAALGPLGVLEATFKAERAPEYLDAIGDDLALWREAGIAHPGWLLQHANWVLAANVALGPWIHTGSEVTNLRAVRDGDRIAVRGRVERTYERKGHQMVDLDLVVAVSDEPVQLVRHSAIYRIRPPSGLA